MLLSDSFKKVLFGNAFGIKVSGIQDTVDLLEQSPTTQQLQTAFITCYRIKRRYYTQDVIFIRKDANGSIGKDMKK